ncbi:MAG: hypothetical protein J2P54_06275, partial [Bradyrhizobiaceae bacterium]|nr:hypothetical protein [Bradyrhizobiaceae bacterium]
YSTQTGQLRQSTSTARRKILLAAHDDRPRGNLALFAENHRAIKNDAAKGGLGTARPIHATIVA